jgi:hypothetical protein
MCGFLWDCAYSVKLQKTREMGVRDLSRGIFTHRFLFHGDRYQILAQADTVLRINFPSPLPELMDVAKLLFLDLRALLRLDCVDLGEACHIILLLLFLYLVG